MLKAPDATDRYSKETIGSLGAMTVAEVIDRLDHRNGGRPFSILIDGGRLADITDLRDMPPKALAGIEILPMVHASDYGFSP